MSDKSTLSYYFTRKRENLLQEAYNISYSTNTNSDIVNINETIVLDKTDHIPACSSTTPTLYDWNEVYEKFIDKDLLTVTWTTMIVVNH